MYEEFGEIRFCMRVNEAMNLRTYRLMNITVLFYLCTCLPDLVR